TGKMRRIVMGQRTNDRILIAESRQPRKMLGDEYARRHRLDRLKLSPHFRRRVRLEVPGVELRRSSPHEDQNAVLGFAKSGPMPRWTDGILEGGASAPGPKLREPEARRRDGTCF